MNSKNIFGIEDDGKTAGMLSYFFVLGWSMAFFTFHKNDKQRLSSYHLRQTLLLYITYLAVRFGVPLIFGVFGIPTALFASPVFSIAINAIFVVFWIIGLDGAFKGEPKPIPFLGRLAQVVFARI